MKKLNKITTLLLALALMMSAFAACGGSGGSGDSSSDAGAADTEANAGFEGIVYTVPDDWTVTEKAAEYICYSIPNSDFKMGVDIMTEEIYADMKDNMPEEMKAENLKEYFEKSRKASDEDKEKYHLDQEERKICDSKAYYTKRANDSDTGYISAAAAWMYDNAIYEMRLLNSKTYDSEGNIDDSAEVMHEDMLEVFDEVIATVKPGDGASFADSVEAPKEIGEVTFEVPEGYAVSEYSNDHIFFEKEGSDAILRLNYTTDEILVSHQMTIDGKKITTIDEYYNDEGFSDEDKMSIAGVDGYVFKYPDENGKLYNCNASFKTDNAVYEIELFTDAYDENGLKPDAVPLTDDEVAAFDALIKSLKQK